MENTQETQSKIEIPKISGFFDELKWLVRAIGEDEKGKEALTYIQVTHDNITACDGFRLHQLKKHSLCETLEEGLYRVIDLKKSIILEKITKELKYPDVSMLIPKKEQLTKVTRTLRSGDVIDTFGLNNKKTESFDISIHLFTLSRQNVCVNYAYLKDAIQGDRFEMYVNNDEPCKKPTLIENDTKLAIVMPLKHY